MEHSENNTTMNNISNSSPEQSTCRESAQTPLFALANATWFLTEQQLGSLAPQASIFAYTCLGVNR